MDPLSGAGAAIPATPVRQPVAKPQVEAVTPAESEHADQVDNLAGKGIISDEQAKELKGSDEFNIFVNPHGHWHNWFNHWHNHWHNWFVP